MNNSYSTTLTIKANGNGLPKAWSTIRYDVELNVPLEVGGHSVMTITGVQSAIRKLDNPADTQPAAVGSSHKCAIVEGILEAYIVEEYAMAECAANRPGDSGSPFLPRLPRLPQYGVTRGGSAVPESGASGIPDGEGGLP